MYNILRIEEIKYMKGESHMYDVVVLGGGPAGVSASLYCKRANKNVLMIYNE